MLHALALYTGETPPSAVRYLTTINGPSGLRHVLVPAEAPVTAVTGRNPDRAAQRFLETDIPS